MLLLVAISPHDAVMNTVVMFCAGRQCFVLDVTSAAVTDGFLHRMDRCQQVRETVKFYECFTCNFCSLGLFKAFSPTSVNRHS